MAPQLVSQYHKSRNVVIITSALIILWHFGVPFKGTLPLIGIDVSAKNEIPYLFGCILVYGVVRLFIEWFQSDRSRRRLLPSRIDLFITVIIAFIAGFFLTKPLIISLQFTKINILSSLAIIAVGFYFGYFMDIAIFNIFFIRSKERAKKLSLPRVPVAVRATWRIGYFAFPSLFLVIFLSLSFSKPMSEIWPLFLFLPILITILSGFSSIMFWHPRDSEGNRTSRRDLIKKFRQVFDRHDAHYQMSGWDKKIASSNSPLYEAAESGDTNTLNRLLTTGVEINEIGMLGWTPLLISVAQQHEKVVKTLLQNGANPNIGNIHGRTPLMFAARYGNKSLIISLLKYGADPNFNESNEPNALSIAAIGGNLDIVQILLDAGANPSIEDFYGKTALDYAEKNNQGEVAAILRKAAPS